MSRAARELLVVGDGISAAALAAALTELTSIRVHLAAGASDCGNTDIAGAAVWSAPDDADRPRRADLAGVALECIAGLQPGERRVADVRPGTACAQLAGGQWQRSDRVFMVSGVGLAQVLRSRAQSRGARVLDGPVEAFAGRIVWATGADLSRHALGEGEHLRYLHARIGRAATPADHLEISYRHGVYLAQRAHRVVEGLFAQDVDDEVSHETLDARLAELPSGAAAIRWQEIGSRPEIYNDAGFPRLRAAGRDWTYRGGCGSGIRYALGAARMAAQLLNDKGEIKDDNLEPFG